MKLSTFLFTLILAIFSLSLINLAGAVECDADLNGTNGYAGGCTVSSSLTLNGSYVITSLNGTGNKISINADNIFFDCNGTTFQGNWSYGGSEQASLFYVNVKNNVTIKNCKINNFYYPVRAIHGTGLVLDNNTFYVQRNVWIQNFSSSLITNSNFTNTSVYGIYISGNAGTNFTNLNITNNIFRNVGSNSYITSAVSAFGVNYYIYNNSFDGQGIEFLNVTSSIVDRNVWNNPSGTSTQKAITSNSGVSNNYTNNIMNSFSGLGYGIWIQSLEVSPIIAFNQMYNLSNQAPILFSGNNGRIYNNSIDLSDKGIWIQGDNNDVYFNLINRSVTGYDGYSTSILVEQIANGNRVYNNTIYNAGTYGIFFRRGSNNNFTNNYIDMMSKSDFLNYGGQDTGEFSCAFGGAELLKSYEGDNTEVSTDNYTKISQYNSTNILIQGNTFGSNVQCYLHAQGVYGLIQDLTNYWFRSFQQPYFTDRSDLYLSNSFNTMTIKNSSTTLTNFTKQGYMGKFYLQDSFTKSYSYFLNLNGTYSNLTIINNLTSALLTNGTSVCNGSSSNLALNSGQVNITLNPNQFCYALDNYNLTEGVSREYSPIWISSSTDTNKHIASNVSEDVYLDTYINLPGGYTCELIKLKYTPNGEGSYAPAFTCANGIITIPNLKIKQSSESNILEILHDNTSGICNNMFKGYSGFFGYAVIFFTLLAILIIVGLIGFAIYAVTGMSEGKMPSINFSWDNAYVVAGIAIFLILAVMAVVGIIILNSLCSI